MLPRLLVTSALLISLQASFPADTGQSLRDRYGPPISENFLVRPGVIATATYGPSGHVCQLVVSPQRLWNSTIGSVNVGDLLDELVPPAERGKYVIGGFVDAQCFPTNDCSGSDGVWENLDIFRNGGTANEHYIRIHWRRGECDVPPSK
jgi:hypothetical protein